MGSRLDLFLLTIAILLGTVLSDLILSKVDRRVSLSLSRICSLSSPSIEFHVFNVGLFDFFE